MTALFTINGVDYSDCIQPSVGVTETRRTIDGGNGFTSKAGNEQYDQLAIKYDPSWLAAPMTQARAAQLLRAVANPPFALQYDSMLGDGREIEARMDDLSIEFLMKKATYSYHGNATLSFRER